MFKNALWSYINDRYEEDGVLVDFDEVYEAFQMNFDSGQPVELIDEVMQGFISIHNLANIQVNWEGTLV